MRGGPKHVHASRDGLAVGRIVQLRLRDADELLQLVRLRVEGEQLAQSLDRRVDRVHLDDVVKLQWQRHAHARRHAAVHARTHACTPRNS